MEAGTSVAGRASMDTGASTGKPVSIVAGTSLGVGATVGVPVSIEAGTSVGVPASRGVMRTQVQAPPQETQPTLGHDEARVSQKGAKPASQEDEPGCTHCPGY
jgi:hypothetical protein